MQHKDRLSDEERAARRKASAAKYRAANREKCNAATRKSQAANMDAKRARDKAWRVANAERIKAQQLEYRKANRARLNAGTRAWQERNREKFNAYQVAYRVKHNDRERNRKLRWRSANPERAAAYTAAWARMNPDRRVIGQQNRRARKAASGGRLSQGLASRLMRLQRGRCVVCRVDLKRSSYHLDHVMPLALGGPHADGNMQLLCPACNLSKNAKHPAEFMRQKGFLL